MLYGDTYNGDEGLVRTLVAIAALTSTATVLTYASMARGSRLISVGWAGALLEITLVSQWHDTPIAIAWASAGAVVPTVLVLVSTELRAWSEPRNAGL